MTSRNLAVCVLLFLFSVAMLTPKLENLAEVAPAQESPRAAAEPAEASPMAAVASNPIGDGSTSHEIMRDQTGHFFAKADVNGASMRLLVDTGASYVVLTPEDALQAGIQRTGETVTAMGVGGALQLSPVVIDRLTVGSLSAEKVPAMIAQDAPMSLLGQSWLSRVSSVQIDGDRMVLR